MKFKALVLALGLVILSALPVSAQCKLALDSTATKAFDASGAPVAPSKNGTSVFVQNPGCAPSTGWVATVDQSWASLTATGATGSGSFFLRLARNAGAARTATVTVSSPTLPQVLTYTVTQAGGLSDSCSFTVTPATKVLAFGSYDVTVTTQAGCAWGVNPLSYRVAFPGPNGPVVPGGVGSGTFKVSLTGVGAMPPQAFTVGDQTATVQR